MSAPPAPAPASTLGGERADRRASLSLLVITLDEERRLERCLSSVQDLVEEIVVVDSGSRDRTLEIAASFAARIHHREFRGYERQKQRALELATGEWVLSLDADEWLDERARREVGGILRRPPPAVAGLELRLLPYYLGGWCRFGGPAREWKLRLARRERARFAGGEVHERMVVDGRVRRLRGRLCHEPYRDLSHQLEKIDRYTDLLALRDRASRARVLFGIAVEPALVLAHRLVIQAGLLDGTRGVVAAAMESWYFFLRYAKQWERRPEEARSEPARDRTEDTGAVTE